MAKRVTSEDVLLREYHTWLRLERGYSPNTIEGLCFFISFVNFDASNLGISTEHAPRQKVT